MSMKDGVEAITVEHAGGDRLDQDGIKHTKEGQIAQTSEKDVSEARLANVERKPYGFLPSLTIIPEIEDPQNYSRMAKYFIVFIVACAATSGPMSAGIYFPALPDLESDLHVSSTVANLSVSFFLLGMGISPLWLAYLSELFGRRVVYLVSFVAYTIFSLLTGFSTSIGELLAFRILAALSSGSAQALGAGTIADIYITQERGQAMGIFYLGPLVGPLLSPVIGGAVTVGGGSWRNTQWFLAAFAAATTLLLVVCLPETLRHPKIIKIHDHGTLRDPTRPELVRHTLLEPFKTFLFFRYPSVFCSVIYASLNFGGLYVMNISIEYAYSHAPYQFSTIIVGCLYLGNSTGYILGSIVGGRWCDHVLKQARSKSNLTYYIPEKRIGLNAWTGAVLAPSGILMWGWTIDKGLFWFVPLLGTFLFGLGTMFIYSAVTTYLIDALPGRGSSAMALNNFIRNILACGGSIAAVPGIDGIGYGPLFSIVASILFLSSVLVLAIVIKGDAWRESAAKSAV